jgi:hypothetical protein
MREFREITADELRPGRYYEIGDYKCKLHGHDVFFFTTSGGNDLIFKQFGIARPEINNFIGEPTAGDFPEVSKEVLVKLYNWFYEKWSMQECSKKITEKFIPLADGETLTLPLNVESQEHWDEVWPKLKKVGFTWADGDELDSFFSECHVFPEHIDQQSDLKLIIDEELTKINKINERV